MTTYKIYKNMITVSFDDSQDVLFSDTHMKLILEHLSLDFFNYACSFPVSAGKTYYYVSNMIEKIQRLRGAYDTQFIIDMLHTFFLFFHRYNYPDFCIILVNEI